MSGLENSYDYLNTFACEKYNILDFIPITIFS